jgi:hypothetical protein
MSAIVVRELVRELTPAGNGPVRVTVRVVTPDLTDPTNPPRARTPWCYVSVACLPGASWWTCPDARTLRRLVDEATAGTSLARHGARIPGDRMTNGWRFHYPMRDTRA